MTYTISKDDSEQAAQALLGQISAHKAHDDGSLTVDFIIKDPILNGQETQQNVIKAELARAFGKVSGLSVGEAVGTGTIRYEFEQGETADRMRALCRQVNARTTGQDLQDTDAHSFAAPSAAR